jgi:hypothetical protein
MSELFDAKGLAARLKRNVTYVYAMKACGFSMPGGRATIEEALAWLAVNPSPRAMKKANVQRPTSNVQH